MQRKQKQKAEKDILRLLFSGFGVNFFGLAIAIPFHLCYNV